MRAKALQVQKESFHAYVAASKKRDAGFAIPYFRRKASWERLRDKTLPKQRKSL